MVGVTEGLLFILLVPDLNPKKYRRVRVLAKIGVHLTTVALYSLTLSGGSSIAGDQIPVFFGYKV